MLGRPLYAPPDTAPCDCELSVSAMPRAARIDSVIAIGQRLARGWHYRDAVEIYTDGLEIAPGDPRLYRHRGHRYITLRRFRDAATDLDRGNALDSTSFDIEYHRGLAYYLLGRFEKAAEIYGRCMAQAERRAGGAGDTSSGTPRLCSDIAIDDDSRVAMTDWRYRALRRAGRHAEAAALLPSITDGMRVRENLSYYENLKRYAGRTTEDAVLTAAGTDSVRVATSAYAMANLKLVEGDTTGARAMLERIVVSPHWPAFAVIAAEADLMRLRQPSVR